MPGFIENLRGKSEGYKRGVALGTSFLVTLLIATVWVSVVFPGMSSNQSVVAKNVNTEQGPIATLAQNIAQPLAAFKATWSSIGSSFTEIKYQAGAAGSAGSGSYSGQYTDLEVISPEER